MLCWVNGHTVPYPRMNASIDGGHHNSTHFLPWVSASPAAGAKGLVALLALAASPAMD